MGPLSEAVDLETLATGISPANQRTAASPDMALSLPAVRNFQPADFASMRDALFAPRSVPHTSIPQGKAAPQRSGRRRAAEGSVEPTRQENLRARVETDSRRLDIFSSAKRPDFSNKQAAAKSPRASTEGVEKGKLTSWVTKTAPLQPPAASGVAGEHMSSHMSR